MEEIAIRPIALRKKDNWRLVSRTGALEFAEEKFNKIAMYDPDHKIEYIQTLVRGIKLSWDMFISKEEYDDQKRRATCELADYKRRNEFIKR